MDDYIKREDAVNAVYHHCPSLTMIDVQTILHEAQSADVQPVVRCKDCEHFEVNDEGETWCFIWGSRTAEDDFCSWGERKDGEHGWAENLV